MKQEYKIGNQRFDFVLPQGNYDVVVLQGMGCPGVNETDLKIRVEHDIREGRFSG